MSNRRALVWLTLLLVVSVAANCFVSWRDPASLRLPRHTLVDPSFLPTEIRVSRAGEAETLLRRTDRWALGAPYAGPADAQVVLRLLDTLVSARVEDALSDVELLRLGRTREDFGLTEPRLSVALSDGRETVRISVGDDTPTSNGVYAAVSGSDVVLVVPQSVRAVADLDAEAFRARDIFPYEPDFVSGFDLRRAGETPTSFSRTGTGWMVGTTDASTAKVNAFLRRLTETTAVDFLWPVGATNEESVVSEARLVGYGLDSASALTVNLRCRDGVDRRISLGNNAESGRAYALVYDGGAIVSVDAVLKAAVLDGMHSFVDTRLFPLDQASVSSYTLTVGETSYVLARGEAGAWRLDSPVVAAADATLASAILGRLLALTPYDLSPEGVRVAVSTNRAPCVVAYSALLGDARLEDLRSREILRVDASLVRRLVATPGGSGARPPEAVVYGRERREWRVETEIEKDRSVDRRNIDRVLAALSPLAAREVVALKAAASDLPRYGLEHPFYTLAVDQEKEGAVRRNVFIGDRTRGGRFATVGSAEAVFILSEETVSALTAPLVEN